MSLSMSMLVAHMVATCFFCFLLHLLPGLLSGPGSYLTLLLVYQQFPGSPKVLNFGIAFNRTVPKIGRSVVSFKS